MERCVEDRQRRHGGVSLINGSVHRTHLAVSKANMRAGRGPPDVSNMLRSIITRGVISPLFIRPNCSAGHFETVAGKRGERLPPPT